MKIGYISGYFGKCGLISYCHAQVKELSKLCEVRVFAERADDAPQETNIVYCWDRNEFPKLELLEEIGKFKPDILVINHEFGYFSKFYQFTTLVSYLRYKGYKVFTILHSVYPYHLDKVVTESAARDIIVHTQEQKDCLISKGLDGAKINIVSHGSSFNSDKEELLGKLWHCWGAPTILSYGFLFHYKGGLRALDIVAELKKKYSDIQYVLLASENPKCAAEHEVVYQEMMKRVEELDLMNNVTIHRGFVSEQVLLSHIRTANLVLLPYSENGEHSVLSASGAVRIALQTTIPIITSAVHLFDGLDNVLLKGKENKDMVNHIVNILDGKIDLAAQNTARVKFIKETSWKNVAAQLLNIFEGK